MSQRLLTEANPRLRGAHAPAGQRVIVPTGGAISTSVARRMADPVEPASSSPTGFHRVRRGETLSGLAAEYGVTVRQLRAWNGLGPSDGDPVGPAAPGRGAAAARAAREPDAARLVRRLGERQRTPCAAGRR